jgi:hypothetical protein
MHPLLELLEGLLPVRLAARLGKLGIGEPSILRVEGLFFFRRRAACEALQEG